MLESPSSRIIRSVLFISPFDLVPIPFPGVPSVCVEALSCHSAGHPCASGPCLVTRWVIRAGRGLVLSLDGPSVCVEVSSCPSMGHPCGLGSHFFIEKTSSRVETLPFPLRWHPLKYRFTCYWMGDIRIVLAFSFGRIMDIDIM